MAALPATGWIPHHVQMPASFPQPSDADLATTRDVLSRLPRGGVALMDGLAFGALPRELIDSFDLKYVALVHHPLAQETGLHADDVERLMTSERAALGAASAIVATSRHTADQLMRDYAVPEGKLRVAFPGTKPAPRAMPQNTSPCLLTVATLTHRKGHDVLIRALAVLKDLHWHSVLVGSLDRAPAVTANIRALMAAEGLEQRVTLCGEMDEHELDTVYAGADVFVLPSRHEGYGMAFAEALARGLPIVAGAAGAVIDTVPADAGLLVPSDDPMALAQALRRILTDHDLRRTLSDAAWTHGHRLPTWDDTAAAVSTALRSALS
ncbi:MAG: glycosyltransferase family 4 protein [Rhodospirillaceae bacterium]|nr:glycosyltransferase family 4 protein [Rhodospirillaceae bacterium]